MKYKDILVGRKMVTFDERKKLDSARHVAELAVRRKKRRESKGLTAAQRMMGETK